MSGKGLLWNLEKSHDDKHKPIQCSEDVQVQRKHSKSWLNKFFLLDIIMASGKLTKYLNWS